MSFSLPVNPVKKRMQAGDVALGMSVRMSRSADIARIAKATGHDFIFIDTQHSIFNLETINHIAQTALAIDIAAVVRVKSIHDPDVSLLLDNGVTGIVYPDINTAAEARRAVDVCRFAPVGKRSVSGNFMHFNFQSTPYAQFSTALNDVALLVCMIETPEGLANIEEICAVPGIDVIHMGTGDFAANIGKPGKFDDPEVVAAQARVIEVARRHGKYAGCGGNRDVTRQANAIRHGVQFVTTQTDISFLASAAQQWTSGVREALAAGARS
ncbi:aldolase [Bordetella sp. H567]|uniref:HpcH/HpaI aldolase family protein n=1 Tax=Bordetella sp. H567 TaxID=1697043 RepID=UPI00081C6178|nr:aldolase/citrate lyase family protein [Bordetella sp. H567]AOB31345.1 aldolase [Bordetella sp. H567]